MAEPDRVGSPALTNYYPPVSFHFLVHFERLGADGFPLKTGDSRHPGDPGDIAFQAVSGLSVQMQTETIKEGGESRFEHTVPLRAKFADLQLKRALLHAESPVILWIRKAVEEFTFNPLDLTIKLLNEDQKPLMVWHVSHAWPKNWKIGDFNAERGEVLIETLDLSYNNFRMRNP